ncbi:MAG: RelA/SpoT domain-containing protein [Bacteroidota bacterium]|nr:RelA/SpoT domain-containing protein [Bacteroidota bacterium]
MNYSKNEINKAGIILKDKINHGPDEIRRAEDILTYWRTIHDAPINTFQANIRLKLIQLEKDGFVAQRLKRSPSIITKLLRNKNMKLSTMQDIAGLRIVLKNLNDVFTIKQSLLESKIKHEFIYEDDYINYPKKSGYRSVHLIYKYVNPKIEESNGLKIEIQIRTKLQHTWATAVETMGTFIDYSLKSSEGPEKILEFFALTGSAFAHLENCEPIPQYKILTKNETFTQVISQFISLGIGEKLRGFTVAAEHVSKKEAINSKYHLIILNLEKNVVNLIPFSKTNLAAANQAYTEVERQITSGAKLQAVLVSIDSIKSLKKAYPNYFLDTREFIDKIDLIKNRLPKLKD